MSKKKNRKPNKPASAAETAAAPKKTASQLKKEQKAEAARQEKERHKKRQRYYGFAAVIALIAVVISFASGSTYGQPVYGWLQVLCYVLMGSCGVIMMRASKYEELEKKQSRMHTMGIVFLMVGLGMALSQIVIILRG